MSRRLKNGWWTTGAIAEYCGVDRATVLRWIKREGERVDSRVPVEAAVLEARDRGRELRGHPGRHAEAPLAVCRDRGADELAVAVEHDGRQRVVERHHRDEEPEREQHGCREAGPTNGASFRHRRRVSSSR